MQIYDLREEEHSEHSLRPQHRIDDLELQGSVRNLHRITHTRLRLLLVLLHQRPLFRVHD
jgi:hypothetical protein